MADYHHLQWVLPLQKHSNNPFLASLRLCEKQKYFCHTVFLRRIRSEESHCVTTLYCYCGSIVSIVAIVTVVTIVTIVSIVFMLLWFLQHIQQQQPPIVAIVTIAVSTIAAITPGGKICTITIYPELVREFFAYETYLPL